MAKVKIDQVDPDTGDVVETFPGIVDAAKEFGVNVSDLAAVLDLDIPFEDFVWKRSPQRPPKKSGPKPRVVVRLDDEGEAVHRYAGGCSEAAEAYNVSPSAIDRAARKGSTVAGFHWRIEGDERVPLKPSRPFKSRPKVKPSKANGKAVVEIEREFFAGMVQHHSVVLLSKKMEIEGRAAPLREQLRAIDDELETICAMEKRVATLERDVIKGGVTTVMLKAAS